MNRLSKLRAMSTTEILFRLQERGANQLERLAFQRGWLSRPDRLRRGLRRDLRAAADWADRLLASRRNNGAVFYPGAGSRGVMRELFATRYQEERLLAERQAAL